MSASITLPVYLSICLSACVLPIIHVCFWVNVFSPRLASLSVCLTVCLSVRRLCCGCRSIDCILVLSGHDSAGYAIVLCSVSAVLLLLCSALSLSRALICLFVSFSC